MRLKGIAIACAALAAGAVFIASCTSVTDSTTGVSIQRGVPTTCIKGCNDQFALLYAEEQKLHLTNVEACQAVPQSEKNACLVAESTRHDAAKTALGLAKIACQTECPPVSG